MSPHSPGHGGGTCVLEIPPISSYFPGLERTDLGGLVPEGGKSKSGVVEFFHEVGYQASPVTVT